MAIHSVKRHYEIEGTNVIFGCQPRAPFYTSNMFTPTSPHVAIDWSGCVLVEINPRKVSGAPILKGTRVQADTIVENYTSGSPIDEIADNFDISEHEIQAVLEYAELYQNSHP